MRLLFSLVLASLALTSVSVQAQDSFCVKYAKAVFNKTDATLTGNDEFQLLNYVVGRVIVGCDENAANRYGIPGVDANGPFKYYAKSACGNGVTKVAGLVSEPLNAPFFNGTAPNYVSATSLQTLNDAQNITFTSAFPSIRFVAVNGNNVTAYPAATGASGSEGLIQHLVSFFGSALKCKFYNSSAITPGDGAYIGRYGGNSNMATVHKNMNITKQVWDAFITTFASTLISFGVTQADVINMVKPVVAPFLYQPTPPVATDAQICNQPGCDCIPGYTNVNNVCVAANGTTQAPTTVAPTTVAPSTVAPTTPPKNTATIITFPPIVALATIGLLALL